MGILDDTLADAARPLPGTEVLRRADDEAAADEPMLDVAPPPADGATTLYRLQKESGVSPPQAPPGLHPAHDGGPRSSPRAVAAVEMHDASLPLVNSRNGLETGEGQASRRQSDVRGQFASSDAAESISSSGDVVSTVVRSNVDTAPLSREGTWVQVQRDDSNAQGSRETGRGAPSGDLHRAAPPGATPEAVAADAPSPPAGAGGRPALHEAAAGPVPQPGPREAGRPRVDTAPRVGVAVSPPPARLEALPARVAFPTAPTPARPAPATDAAPRLSIGRIEVVVLAPAPAARAPAAVADSAFASKNYLRRL